MKKWLAMFLILCLALTAGFAPSAKAAGESEEGLMELLIMLWSGDGEKDGVKDLFAAFWSGDGDEEGVGDLLKALWYGDGEKEGVKEKLYELWNGEDEKGGLKDLLKELWSGDGETGGVKGWLKAKWYGVMNNSGVKGLLGSLNLGQGASAAPETQSPRETHGNIAAADSKDAFYGVWTLSKLVINGVELNKEAVSAMLGGAGAPQAALTEDSLTINFKGKESSAAVVTELKDGALNLLLGGDDMTVYLTDSGEALLCLGNADVYLAAVR